MPAHPFQSNNSLLPNKHYPSYVPFCTHECSYEFMHLWRLLWLALYWFLPENCVNVWNFETTLLVETCHIKFNHTSSWFLKYDWIWLCDNTAPQRRLRIWKVAWIGLPKSRKNAVFALSIVGRGESQNKRSWDGLKCENYARDSLKQEPGPAARLRVPMTRKSLLMTSLVREESNLIGDEAKLSNYHETRWVITKSSI